MGRRSRVGSRGWRPMNWETGWSRWAWPAVPDKSEELWALLSLPGKPGEVRGDAARPAFGGGAFAGRPLGEVRSLFPRIELEAKA